MSSTAACSLRRSGKTVSRFCSDSEGSNFHVRVSAGDAYDAGPQDIIFLAVKTTQIAEATRNIDALMHDDTIVITVQNGVLWWYFQRHGGEHEGRHL